MDFVFYGNTEKDVTMLVQNCSMSLDGPSTKIMGGTHGHRIAFLIKETHERKGITDGTIVGLRVNCSLRLVVLENFTVRSGSCYLHIITH